MIIPDDNLKLTTLNVQALCEQGPVRDNNEDMISLGYTLLRNERKNYQHNFIGPKQYHLLVSDGMGGHEHGEQASEALLGYLNACFDEGTIDPENAEETLREQVKRLSDELNRVAEQEHQSRPMGCTLTGVVWIGGKVLLLNAGDSRTYLFRDPYLRQLTTDQTERGLTGNPNASKLLLNCIGGGSHGQLVVEDITENVMDGDVFLVCSDGLTDLVNDAAIEAVLAESDTPAELLYEMACENGGHDNISIIVAHVSMEYPSEVYF